MKHILMKYLVLSSDLLDAEGVISMLKRRCRDERVNVRKAAVQAVEGFLLFGAPFYQHEVQTPYLLHLKSSPYG